MNNNAIITELQQIHNNKYDYSKLIFNKVTDKITIICPIHGEFIQIFRVHYKGHGCKNCSNDKMRNQRAMSIHKFIERANIIHNNEYDYSHVEYKNARSNIKIICSEHGEFLQTPWAHLKGRGCQECGKISSTKSQTFTLEQFLKKAYKIHGTTYDYSHVDYKNARTNIKIICLKHGEFLQTPHRHLIGRGCQKCTNPYSNMQIEWINLLKFRYPNIQYIHNKGEYKIGPYYVDGYDANSKTIFEFHGDFWHGNPCKYKECDINPKTKTSFYKLYKKTQKKRDYIVNLGYKYIELWENDWLKFINFISKIQQKIKNKAYNSLSETNSS